MSHTCMTFVSFSLGFLIQAFAGPLTVQQVIVIATLYGVCLYFYLTTRVR